MHHAPDIADLQPRCGNESDAMNYRDILYRDYSSNFGGMKAFDATVQFAQYEATYPALPERGAAVLDIGCGKGEWLAWLASRGFERLTGVDGSGADLDLAREHGPPQAQWVHGDGIAFLESNPGGFDLIHAKDVIEHLTKDEFLRFLLAARAALKPGGRLWLMTFNAQSPLASATRYGDFTHETGHTPASLAQCARACGFETVSVAGRHFCSSSMSGRVRGIFGRGVYALARLILKVRHGAGACVPGVDLHTALPDLFVEAQA